MRRLLAFVRVDDIVETRLHHLHRLALGSLGVIAVLTVTSGLATERRWRWAFVALIMSSLIVVWYALKRFVRTTIREAKAAADARREWDRTSAHLALVTDSSPTAFSIVGGDGRLSLVNTAWRALPAVDDRNTPDSLDALHPALARPLQELVALAKRTGVPQRRELSEGDANAAGCRSSAEERPWRVWAVTAFPVQGRGDLEDGVGLSLADITSLRQMEQQMRRGQRLEAIGRLAGGVAHDFNNILTAIIGFTDMAAQEAGGRGRIHTDLQQVRKAADRAALLTRQLLSFSRQHVLQPRVFNLGDVVRDMELMIRRLIGSHITTHIAVAPETWNIHMDLGRMEQVLLNLAINARDAMEAGGMLSIAAGNATREQLLDAITRGSLPADAADGEFALLRVQDTGTGIAAALHARIFEPFFTTKLPGQGTGLGLATVLNIVRDAGGYVTVASAEGEGTVFEVYIPRSHESAMVPVPAQDGDRRRRSGTVLVAEDDRDVRQLIEYVLTESGYLVHVAKDGRDALDVLERRRGEIDLLITDLVMPRMGGVELSRHPTVVGSALPVLFVSGYAPDSTVRMTVLPPEAVVVAKPFTPAQLVEVVAAAMGQDADQSETS